MKKICILLFAFVQCGIIFSQSKEELKNAESITWFGVDFSESRFIGQHDFKSPWELKEKLIPAWNQIILHEPEKYNLKTYFKISKIEMELGDAYDRNSKIDENSIILGMEGFDYELNEGKIQAIISEYKTEYMGYGLVFIVESFNKLSQRGTVWVTYFHIPSKKVILTKKMSAEPMGFGIKNYWARVFYRIMQESEESIDRWFK